jgi:hypothetical protein
LQQVLEVHGLLLRSMDVQGGDLQRLGDGVGTSRGRLPFVAFGQTVGSPAWCNAAIGVVRRMPVDEGLVVAAVPFPPARKLLELSKNKGAPCRVAIHVKACGANGLEDTVNFLYPTGLCW